MAQSDSVNTGINTSPSSPKSVATPDATISSSTASAALVPLSNTQQVINLKLTNNNYLFWRMQMKPYLIGQGVFSFVDGSTQCPSPYTSDISCSLLSAWKQQDQLILSALLSSLSVEVLHLVVDCPTSASVWSTLERTLASPSNSRIMQLHGSLQDLRQGDDTVTLYLQRAKGLYDELAAAGRPISLTDFNLYVFRGLRSDFRDFVTTLSTKAEPLSYSELHSHLSTHEFIHRNVVTTAPLLPTPAQLPSVYVAQRGYSGSQSNAFRGRRSGWKNHLAGITISPMGNLFEVENQLPLFIIQEIYDWVYPRSQPFLDLATCYWRKYSLLKRVETSPGVEGSRHFTDLLRDLMLSGATEPINYISNPPMLKDSAVMLRKAGVRFQVSQNKCLVNITFDKGVLEIPCLEIDHCFERLVRNIMALEQCCYPSDAYICSYIKFMDHLIDSAEDVRLLVGKGIIVHTLGDDAAVSNMINSLCENIGDNYTCFDYTCFGDISRKLNDHHASLFNRAMATLLLVYFPNFWRGTATLAAALLLILTFIQTLSSLKLFG